MKHLFRAILVSLCLAMIGPSTPAGEKGTAAEAVALVKKAAAHLTAVGKEQAFRDFHDPQGQFVPKDLYVFVIDMNGTTVAHGGSVRLVGKNVTELKDADGKPFIKDMIELTRAKGKGWIDYKWVNPLTKSIEAKSTYVERVGDVMIGSGVYR